MYVRYDAPVRSERANTGAARSGQPADSVWRANVPIAFSIAAGLFYPAFAELLRPEIAALSMAGSSLLVALDALSLKRTKVPGIRTRQPVVQGSLP
jgi:cation transport ATPase